MAADFFLGESLVGDGNEVAHIDLIIGSKSGPAGAAFCNALTNNKDGFTTLLAVVAPNLAAMLAEVVHDDPDSTLGWCDDQTEFEFGLDLILDGLDRMRETA